MDKVRDTIKNIKENLTQKSSSNKSEIQVMKAMLNDTSYEVGIYGREGVEGTVCPAKEARVLISSVISSTAKIPVAEAEKLAEDYEFTKRNCENMIAISKEFVNTYLQTDRKLPLGGRETSDVSLILKNVPEAVRTYPKILGIAENGDKIRGTGEVLVPVHDSVKIVGSCPSWCK